jgi:hypothetical protein
MMKENGTGVKRSFAFQRDFAALLAVSDRFLCRHPSGPSFTAHAL